MTTTPNTPDATLTEHPAPELEITTRVIHKPTGNLGVITGLAPDATTGAGDPEPLAQVEWTAGGSTGTSMVPLAELDVDGATITPITAKATKATDAKAAKAKAEAKLGTEPGSATGRERYAALSKTKAAKVYRSALTALMDGATKAAAWTAALDEHAPVEPTPAAEPKAAPATRLVRPHAGEAVDGYTVRWPHPAYDLLLTTDKTAERDAWLCRCNIHGRTTPVASGKDGDAKGKAAERATWCSGCKRDAAKAATAADITTPAAPAAE